MFESYVKDGIESFKKNMPVEFVKAEKNYKTYTNGFDIGFPEGNDLSEKNIMEVGSTIKTQTGYSLLKPLGEIDIKNSFKFTEEDINNANTKTITDELNKVLGIYDGIIINPVIHSIIQISLYDNFTSVDSTSFYISPVFKVGVFEENGKSTNVYCAITQKDIIPFNYGDIFYTIDDITSRDVEGMYGVGYTISYV